MSHVIYFEGGPMNGQETAVQELKPEHVIQMAPKTKNFLKPDEYGSIKDVVRPTTHSYLREYTPHREGVVTYFWTEEDRQEAYREDTDDPDALREAQLAGYLHAHECLYAGDSRSSRLC